MATYNGAKYLDEQLQSFARQSRLPDELVVCDDQSTDGTVEILRAFQSAAPFCVLVHENATKLGFTGNFSKALAACSGQLVFLSDQDDVWYPEKVAVVTGAFATRPQAQVMVHDADLADEELRSSGATYLEQVMSGYGNSRSLITGALTAVRREFLSHALPVPDGIVGHDIWLHGIADMLGVRHVLQDKLQVVRRHSANTSGWVASSVNPIGRLDVWRSQARTRVAADYTDRALINQKGAELLRQLRAGGHGYSTEAIDQSLQYLARERAAIDSRSELARASWVRQKMLCVLMLWRGEYGFFNGYRSFLRDLAR
jgi:glycosyltransferase involved in cell wall biosynthesis